MARRAPAVAPEFGVEDLVEWLSVYDRVVENDDAIFAALLTAEPHLWPRIRRLEIIRADGCSYEALDNGLLVLGGDVAAPALNIFRVTDGGPARRKFLERHGVPATLSVKDAFAYALDAAARGDGAFTDDADESYDERWWALLDLLRRAVAAGDSSLLEDPRAATVVRVPLVEGEAALAGDVNQATFFGVAAFLPPDLDAAIGALVGDGPSTAAVATRAPTAGPYPARGAAVEWEALLDGLGCRRPRLDELGFEVRAAAGAALASAPFWTSLRPFAVSYVESRLKNEETLAFLRSLPAKRVDGEVKCLRDLFLRDAFYPLCGGLLPYAFERSDGADGFPSLSTTGAQATRCLVAKLVRADPSDAADARAALEVLAGATRKDGVFQAAAALYGVAAMKLAAVNQPWVLVEADDELQLELPTNCVWDDNEQLCELARAKRLAPFYAGCRGQCTNQMSQRFSAHG